MTFDPLEKIANALLYEGYMLYPYRPDSIKNRQRWNFGTLCPPAYNGAAGASEPCDFRSEFLVIGTQPSIELRLRFLQLARAQKGGTGWEQGEERTVELSPVSLLVLQSGPRPSQFDFPFEVISDEQSRRMLRDISGAVTLQASAIAPEVFHVSIEVRNTTICHSESREDALLQAMVSAHVIAHVSEGEFVSLLEPRGDLVEAAAGCRNTGVFPVLAGVAPEREFLLISPIILYDYPQVAPESLGDFNDATEIDEMLTLRVLTLTDQEKEQMRAADPKARAILEQSCGIGEEQFLKLHGAVRGLRRTGGKP